MYNQNQMVLCMLVLSSFLIDKAITFEKLKEWNDSDSEWKRRALPQVAFGGSPSAEGFLLR